MQILKLYKILILKNLRSNAYLMAVAIVTFIGFQRVIHKISLYDVAQFLWFLTVDGMASILYYN